MIDTPTRRRFIYITGCDGSGKSTHASAVVNRLRRQSVPVSYIWLRFPFLLSVPLLAYARWRKYSWQEDHGGVRFGFWSFSRSPLLCHLLPWTLLLDAALHGFFRIYLPLWLGRTVVCERYVLDVLVDLSIAFDDPTFSERLPGRLFPHLLPRSTQVIVLDLDAATILSRRPDLVADRALDWKLDRYRELCRDYHFFCLPNHRSLAQVSASIQQLISGGKPE